MARVLICDDEPAVRFTLEEVLGAARHDVVAVGSGTEALARLEGVSAVVTDLAMPGMDGLELLAAVRERDPSLPVVLLTARGGTRAAVAAIKRGAYDYLDKPFGVDELRAVVDRAVEARTLREQARTLTLERAVGRPIVGASAAFRRVLDEALRVAPRDVTVLLRGETGTGKELVASVIHAASRRAERVCVRFNCAAIPTEVAEAELFGHARGAFTGAVGARRGFFSQADGGTLVLDEVGELPVALQGKILRALQEGEIQPVGAGRVERVDVRVVASTHRDLRAEVAAGRFREDLYYRLAVVELRVPALRERPGDIAPLAEEFRRRFALKFGLDDVRLAPSLIAALEAREWPGNVRELEHAVARMLALSEGGVLEADALATSAAREAGARDAPGPTESGAGLRAQVGAFERGVIARTLAEARGNQSEAARRLGITRVTLIDKLKRHGLFAR